MAKYVNLPTKFIAEKKRWCKLLTKDLEGNVSCGREAHFVICCARVSARVKTVHFSYGVAVLVGTRLVSLRQMIVL